jgi:hypothetical protein
LVATMTNSDDEILTTAALCRSFIKPQQQHQQKPIKSLPNEI